MEIIKKQKVRTIVKTIVKRPKKIYVASVDGDMLHIKDCPYAKYIEKKSRVIFKSKTKAFDEGYKACSCIKKIKEIKRRKRRIVKKKIVKKPKVRTIVKTVVKKPKKTYIASKEGEIIHEKNCPFAKNIMPKSKIVFKSKTKALNEGYKACSCIKKVKKKRTVRRKKTEKKAAKVKPKIKKIKIKKQKVRTIVKTIVKRPKKIYVASRSGSTLHEKNCPFAKKIGEKNRIYFRSKTKAFDEGYKACNCI